MNNCGIMEWAETRETSVYIAWAILELINDTPYALFHYVEAAFEECDVSRMQVMWEDPGGYRDLIISRAKHLARTEKVYWGVEGKV